MNQRMMATALLAAASLFVGCHANKLSSCPGGQCETSVASCGDGACQVADPGEAYGANTNYLANGGRSGPLAALHGRHHQALGAQSHTGPQPGPAMGPASPTYGYPYYTTRGPRDFLNPNPPSIGP